jgi:hypothetical protein
MFLRTFVDFKRNIRRCNPEDRVTYNHRCNNLHSITSDIDHTAFRKLHTSSLFVILTLSQLHNLCGEKSYASYRSDDV